MKEFMQTHKVYLTPLSPIHIGCGEDFEPTNYVIKGNNLYYFEASKLGLSEQHLDHLLYICKEIDSDSIQNIQNFFAQEDIIDLAIKNAGFTLPVSPSIFSEWKEKLGKTTQIKGNGKKEFNALEIARCSYTPYTNLPYIPSSSLKGTVITSILDKKNKQDKDKLAIPDKFRNKEDYNEKIRQLNSDLINRYIGDFSKLESIGEKILSQRIKFSDFLPSSNQQPLSKVLYVVNIKKELNKKGKVGKGVPVRKECIQPMQFRAFSSSLTLLNEKNSNQLDLSTLIKCLNEFNLPILEREYNKLLELGVCDNINYIENIKILLKENCCALVRLGHSGSESKVYSDHDLRSILVNNEPRKEATTLWLASDSPDKLDGMFPLGWGLLEFTDMQEDNLLLQKWCQNPKVFLDLYQKQLNEDRKLMEEQRAKAEALNSLSENHRKVIALQDKFNSSNEKQIDSSSSLLKEVKALIENEAINWSNEDKLFMAKHITKELITNRVELRKKNADKDLNKLLNKLGIE